MLPKVIIKENSFIAKIAARKMKAPTMAITIGSKICLHNVSKENFLQNTHWLCHELKHVEQFRKYGFFLFIFKYLFESFKKGYLQNKYEIEARAAENDFSLLDKYKIN